MANKWMKDFMKMDGALDPSVEPEVEVIQSSSPSFNFMFGAAARFGIQIPYTTIIFGPPKCGKTVLLNDLIAQMHRDFPDGIAAKFNTEYREKAQQPPSVLRSYGIDLERYFPIETNTAAGVFDQIEQKLASMVDDGMPLKLVAIDSITGILGRRAERAESIDKFQIGDRAQTLGEGFKRILAVQRRCGFALVLTDHVRVQMDEHERMRGNLLKMAASYGVQHNVEHFLFAEPILSKEGKTDLLGKEYTDEDFSDAAGRAAQTAHKIRVTMTNNSFGPKMRRAIITLSDTGAAPKIINRHEEIFLLGTEYGNVIQRPNNTTYQFGDKKWVGKEAMLEAIKGDKHLYSAIWAAIKEADIARMQDTTDAAVEL